MIEKFKQLKIIDLIRIIHIILSLLIPVSVGIFLYTKKVVHFNMFMSIACVCCFVGVVRIVYMIFHKADDECKE